MVECAVGPWCLPPFLEMSRATGARRGDVLALRWCDVRHDVSFIDRALCQTRDGLIFKSTKTEEPRRVELPATVLPLLARHRERQDEFRRQFGPDYRSDLDLIFANPDGSPLMPNSVSATVSRLCRRTGMPQGRIAPHRAPQPCIASVGERRGPGDCQRTPRPLVHRHHREDLRASPPRQGLRRRPDLGRHQGAGAGGEVGGRIPVDVSATDQDLSGESGEHFVEGRFGPMSESATIHSEHQAAISQRPFGVCCRPARLRRLQLTLMNNALRAKITRRLRNGFHVGIRIDASIVKMMLVDIRDLLELVGESVRYKALKFHCDWILHPKLTGPRAQRIIRAVDVECVKTMERKGLKDWPTSVGCDFFGPLSPELAAGDV